MNSNHKQHPLNPGGRKYYPIIWATALLVTVTTRLLAADVTFPPGTYIIDMGVTAPEV